MIRTRQATESDYPAVLKIQKLAFKPVAAKLKNKNIPPLTQTLEELTEECRRGICIVAEEDRKIIGSVRAQLTDGRALINRLVVHPDQQRRGAARALVQRIETILRQQVAEAVLFTDINDEITVPFYLSMGYEPYEERQQSEDLTFVYMKKTIR